MCHRTIFLSKSAGLQKLHFSFVVLVYFVTDKDNHNIRARQASGIRQPCGNMVEALPAAPTQLQCSHTKRSTGATTNLEMSYTKMAPAAPR